MKIHFRYHVLRYIGPRYVVPVILAAALVTGCTLSATPPNIPRTGGTTTPAVNGTPLNNGTPGQTGTPAATTGTSDTQGLVTGTPGAGYPVATNTPSTGYPVDTNTPGATATTSGGVATQVGAPTANPIGSEEPYDTPAPTTGGTANPGGLATATTAPAVNSIAIPAQAQAIQFPANATSYAVTTDLAQGGTKAYQIQANAGQRIYITIDGNAVMQVYGPGENAITGVVAAINPVKVPLSQAGNYTIALQGTGPVVMSVYIPAANANQNVAAPVPSQLTPIQFQSGATSASFNVNTTAGTPLAYTLNVQPGQQMTVTTNGNATVTLLAPDKVTMIPSAQMPTHEWLYTLNQGGNYTLVLLGNGPVTVTVGIPALGGSSGGNTSGTAIPVTGNAERVNFGAGNASATLNKTLVSGTPQAFVLNVTQGQTLYVSTTGSVDVTIYGPGNNVLVNGHASYPNRWSVKANQTGDYTFVVSGSGPCQLVFYIPPQ
jgi:hypothetical protein